MTKKTSHYALCNLLASATGSSQENALAFLNALTFIITKELFEGRQVSLSKFGIFRLSRYKPRLVKVQSIYGKNHARARPPIPNYIMPESWHVRFKPSSILVRAGRAKLTFPMPEL